MAVYHVTLRVESGLTKEAVEKIFQDDDVVKVEEVV